MMARNKTKRHGPLITLKEAVAKYQRPRWWFTYYRNLLTPINADVADLSRRYTYLYEDEVIALISKRPYQPRHAA